MQPWHKNATSSWLGWPAQSFAICDKLRRSPPHAPGRPGYHLVAVPAMSPVGPPTPPGWRRGRPSPVQPSRSAPVPSTDVRWRHGIGGPQGWCMWGGCWPLRAREKDLKIGPPRVLLLSLVAWIRPQAPPNRPLARGRGGGPGDSDYTCPTEPPGTARPCTPANKKRCSNPLRLRPCLPPPVRTYGGATHLNEKVFGGKILNKILPAKLLHQAPRQSGLMGACRGEWTL